MTTLVEDDSPREALLFDLHIPIGVTLLARLVLRIALRLAYRPPPTAGLDPGHGTHRRAARPRRALRASRAGDRDRLGGCAWSDSGSRRPCRNVALEAPCGTAHPAAARASVTRERPSTVPEPVRVRRARCTGPCVAPHAAPPVPAGRSKRDESAGPAPQAPRYRAARSRT